MENIKYGIEASEGIKKGMDTLANAVKTTLGPKGKNVIIDRGAGMLPLITKDGVTVAKHINLEDRFEAMGAQLIQEVASQAEQGSGDGTTTATVITQAILKEGLKLTAAGYDPNELKMGIDRGVMQAEKYLNSIAIPVTTDSDMVKSIATISANNNEEIGELIANAFKLVGEHGGVDVAEGRGSETEIEVVKGLQFDRGMVSPYFSTNPDGMEVTLKDPYIMLVDGKLSRVEDVVPTLENVIKAGRSLLIIAEDITGQALATLAINKTRGGAEVCAVKVPGFGSQRGELLDDYAVLTDGAVCDIKDIDTFTGGMLGQADSVTITQHSTVVVGAKGMDQEIQERIGRLTKEKEKLESSFERKQLENRIAKMAGGIALISVGGNSEVEMREKMHRIIDAKEAVISALEEGIVPGGGVALLEAINHIDDVDNETEQKGIELLKEALKSPIRTICENAGKNGDVVIESIRRHGTSGRLGYDAKNDEYHDMIVVGIIDPKKVTKVALRNASSVAGTVLTTGCAIT